MKHTSHFVLLMLSAIALRGQTEEPTDALTIYTRFAHPPSSLSLDSMKAELDAVMVPFHFRFYWRPLENVTGHEVVAEVMVVTFKGVCRIDTLPPWGSPPGTLGWTHIADGVILPFADVDCDQIRELMASTLATSSPLQREVLMGRAMARVLAHEMYHFLAHTTKHASSGLAKAHYTGADLARNLMRFDEAQLFVPTRAPSAIPPPEESQSPLVFVPATRD